MRPLNFNPAPLHNRILKPITQTLKDILDVLEEIIPSSAAEEWDNTGLQVGHFSQKVSRIFISLDPTLKAVKKASKTNAQLLLTHHPLIFKPLSCLNPEVYPGDVIFEAFKKGISIASVHTNLDRIRDGINDMLATLFGLRNVEVLQKRDTSGDNDAGLGIIGNLPESMTLSKMIKIVKATLGSEIVKVVGRKNLKIKRVAIVGGSGGGLISLAAKKSASLLITGDVRHHEAREAETLGLALIDGGHFHTERAALRLFSERLKDKFKELAWDITLEFYGDEQSPARYE